MSWLIVFFATVLITGCASADKGEAPQTIRVMTYNIHHGEGTDEKIDLDRIARLIKREKVDIVGLQEIDRGVRRSGGRDLIKELSKLTGMDFYFDRNIYYQGGVYGNAVLTRFPILQKKNTHYKMLRPNEQRGVQQVVLDVYGKKLLFMNTHIDFHPEDDERLMNAKELRQIISENKALPIILAGDFNDTPNSRVCAELAEFLHDCWALAGEGAGFTFPSDNREKRIDYLWVSRDSAIKPLKLWVPPSNASDHLPVVGEFELR